MGHCNISVIIGHIESNKLGQNNCVKLRSKAAWQKHEAVSCTLHVSESTMFASTKKMRRTVRQKIPKKAKYEKTFVQKFLARRLLFDQSFFTTYAQVRSRYVLVLGYNLVALVHNTMFLFESEF